MKNIQRRCRGRFSIEDEGKEAAAPSTSKIIHSVVITVCQETLTPQPGSAATLFTTT
ncbi:hypothetical protein EXN66_Car014005 [Channa argus]|uniref:Uncharacterized protein n=1 Tax=Channa argus TaxID=215402 RepID=A0A6G1Q7E1_CHAAH|nr:hypothetical protein EXN66_Car014005 [Channa argus]